MKEINIDSPHQKGRTEALLHLAVMSDLQGFFVIMTGEHTFEYVTERLTKIIESLPAGVVRLDNIYYCPYNTDSDAMQQSMTKLLTSSDRRGKKVVLINDQRQAMRQVDKEWLDGTVQRHSDRIVAWYRSDTH